MAIPYADDFRKMIEMEVLKVIKELADKDDTSSAKIQQIAQTTLKLIRPQMQLTELYQNAVKLDDIHPELAPVVFKIMREYEEKYHKKTIDMVADYVKAGKHDDAQGAVKKLLEFKAHEEK
jgi:hypothetical protein